MFLFCLLMKASMMVIIVRYWDDKDLKVQYRYLPSSFLGHGKAEDLQKHFNSLATEIYAKKVFQVSMDGPTVNHKIFKLLSERRW